MIDKNFWWKVLLIAGITGFAWYQIYPFRERLKGGIDLMGGHSLLYEIDDTGIDASRRRDLAQRVMAILKERVDPKGQRNLVWRPVGTNRLEIQIPRPPEEVVRAREAYRAVRSRLAATELNRNQIRLALAQPDARRDAALKQLVHGDASREPLLAPLAEAYKAWQAKQAAAPGTPETEDAYEAYRTAEEKLLRTNIGVERVEDILALGKGEQRDKALDALCKEHPTLKPLIEELVRAFDPWSRQRGALDDPADLKRLLLGAGVLEFRILPTPDPQKPLLYDQYVRDLAKRGPRAKEEDLYAWFEIKNPASFLHIEDTQKFDEAFEARKKAGSLHYVVEKYANKYYVLASRQQGETLLRGTGQGRWALASAVASRDPETNQPCVLFDLDERGGVLFGALTRANINRPLCILLDDVAYSAPSIRSEIRRSGQITGDFTINDVMYLVNTLEAGSLPARLKPTPIMEKSIGPSLGMTNRTRGMWSSVIGVSLTLTFMLVYYLYGGFIANVAVLLNLLLTLSIMAMLQATFTLPGIAGLMLSVAMAVDANVLIYERMREEFQKGTSLRMAVKAGYEKAMSAIIDSNVTTVITCVILGYVGTEEVKGFAYTLGFGIATSMFTALFVTRQFFTMMVPDRLDNSATLYPLYGIGGMLGLGAVLYGLARILKMPESVLASLGELFGACGIAGVILLGLMWLCRITSRATRRWHPNRLPMMRLMGKPNIDWMGLRYVFWPASAVVVFGGLAFFAYQNQYHADDLYDIEFLGGTAAQIEVKPDSTLVKDRKDADEIIRRRITGDEPGSAVTWLSAAARAMEEAEVRPGSVPTEFVVTSKALNARQIQSFLQAVIESKMEQVREEPPAGNSLTVHTQPDAKLDLTAMQAAVKGAARYARTAADKLRHATIQMVGLEQRPGEPEQGKTFEIVTTETNSRIVREAIVASMGEDLVIQPAVSLQVLTDAKAQPTDPAFAGMFPVDKSTLGAVLRNAPIVGTKAATDVSAFSGGVAFVLKDMSPPITENAIVQRLQQMRLQPDFEAYAWRDFRVIPLAQTDPTNANSPCTAAAVVVSDEHNRFDESPKNWRQNLAEPEVRLAKAALETGKSLQKVTRFSPSVAEQGKTRALAAIVLAMIVTIGYIWFRFGSITTGLCNIASLIHDIAVAMGLVAFSHFFYSTFIGQALGVVDFRIDLTMIAAFLTIIGYSQNDTIVIFDRVREIRGKLSTVDARMVTDSVNQTLSRTILTGTTTLVVLLVMYIWGGPGIHGFCYAMLIGVLTGTYSSIAVAGALAVTPSALRVFYYVFGFGCVWVVMAALGTQWEDKAVVLGGAILLAGLIYGELSSWRNQAAPGDVWFACFGWLAVLVVVWVITAVIGTLITSTTNTMIYIRGLVPLAAGGYGAMLLVKTSNRLKPLPVRVTT